MFETVLFYLLSLGVIFGGMGVVLSRSAVRSALSLVLTLCLTAGLFILLRAFLVATILVLVYAGAILVLFLFVVMLIDVKKISSDWRTLELSPLLALLAAGLVFLETCFVIRGIPASSAVPLEGTAESIARLLFSRYVLPFELSSLLLLAAVVSVVVLAKKDAV